MFHMATIIKNASIVERMDTHLNDACKVSRSLSLPIQGFIESTSPFFFHHSHSKLR